ncbi:MAG TPA: Ig-like domain repeat protein [Nocardioidaceae bacterium]|nr:Ig-like domain repeat protein [Nocardioidaceae bacterium]
MTCTLTDSEGGDSKPATFTVTVNQAPRITGPDTASFQVGRRGGYHLDTVVGFPAPTFTAAGLPAGLAIDATTGAISGTPGNGTAGTHDVVITADNGIGSEAQLPVTITVSSPPPPAAATTTTLTVPNGAGYGEQVTLVATVSGGVGGMVEFAVDGVSVGNAEVGPDGRASLDVEPGRLHAGSHEVVARYDASTGYADSVSAPATLVVDPAPLEVTASDVRLDFGQPVADSYPPAITGLVAGDDESVLTGSATCRPAPGVAGHVGEHSITCTGDLASPDYTVGYAPGTLTIVPLDTKISLAAPRHADTGDAITLTATVTTAAGKPPAAARTTSTALRPAGAVTFRDGGTVLGSARLDEHGVATLTLPRLKAGTHRFTAAFAGGSGFAASTTAVDATTVVAVPESASPLTNGQQEHTLATHAEQRPSSTAPAETLPATGAGGGLGALLMLGLLLLGCGCFLCGHRQAAPHQP